ncbi:hypothetical protein JYK14_08210 [Siccirubricoccus sp. KC 17139]|uniref:Uncharacterized protein n=1 Tax=Siccirubricoccus soli TaxID=2899147 RepID=A0ABT1D2N5_9PROT|nr:hypothetical protein [Siccirubricoccus soli]MCO6416149.1 hypothetical protein [Siccirubricoccus soli]MCP2682283.1 hypothetical protein [Siccirubricoccus soli]
MAKVERTETAPPEEVTFIGWSVGRCLRRFVAIPSVLRVERDGSASVLLGNIQAYHRLRPDLAGFEEALADLRRASEASVPVRVTVDLATHNIVEVRPGSDGPNSG